MIVWSGVQVWNSVGGVIEWSNGVIVWSGVQVWNSVGGVIE